MDTTTNTADNKLVVLWTSPDKEVADRMVFMYVLNSKLRGWWDQVTLIVWGPSQKLICEDEELQLYLAKLKEVGVELLACIACANSYGLTADLEKLGIEVKSMGQPLTELLKGNSKVITF